MNWAKYFILRVNSLMLVNDMITFLYLKGHSGILLTLDLVLLGYIEI